MRSLVNTSIYNTVFVSNNLSDINFYEFQTYTFPLFLYNETKLGSFFNNRKPNLNMDTVRKIEKLLNLKFTAEKEDTENTFIPIDILDYIYGVLHSDKYREKYKEFLKIDFPRTPYPHNTQYFFNIAKFGKQLREIHLLKSPIINNFITSYPVSGDNEVIKPKYKDNKVYINSTQYFDNVPEVAWNFYIGVISLLKSG